MFRMGTSTFLTSFFGLRKHLQGVLTTPGPAQASSAAAGDHEAAESTAHLADLRPFDLCLGGGGNAAPSGARAARGCWLVMRLDDDDGFLLAFCCVVRIFWG